jgi:hypothetical protein
MKSSARSRLECNAIMKVVREQSRAKFAAFNEALERVETMFRDIEGDTTSTPLHREYSAHIIQLFS